ncbi:hypothetical protein FN846DRAFT_906725 [Sphaerosporella brunnea]|uniref:Ankyrin repeat-containing domain protein n=1 Tax=Sphaerosporella brunnea TaxID=1250544 RepID=A0A5J5EZ34_9PEZI|nr:hypothetical protein FN846DRAFT_906725 [Sphaerosporella brunnea]
MSSTTPYLLAELLLAIAELLELPDREAIVKEIVKQADVVVVLQNIRQTPYQAARAGEGAQVECTMISDIFHGSTLFHFAADSGSEALARASLPLSAAKWKSVDPTCRFFRIAFTVPLLRRIRDTLIRRLSDILQNNNNVRLLNYLLDDGLPVGQLKELRNCEQ